MPAFPKPIFQYDYVVQDKIATMLDYLKRRDLFVVDRGRSGAPNDPGIMMRYHHIFHNFLREQIASADFKVWSGRATRDYLVEK